MNRLDHIRKNFDQAQRGLSPDLDGLLEWYVDDVTLLLQVADAALIYRTATQVPDGVQAAEQKMFEALDRLEAAV